MKELPMLTPLEMIPDRPGREVAFEPLLDELLPVFCTGWEMPQIMVGEHPHHRCEVKRLQIGEAARQDPDATRKHAGSLIHAAMHDQCRSGIRQLVQPLVESLGYRPVQGAIIEYVRTGSDAEKVGATMAWYWARPGLKYDSREALKRREPTKESRAAVDALADLRDQYRAACLTAFLACDDPDTRQDLSLGFTLDPAAYPTDLQPALERARQIITAEPDQYRRILACAPCPPTPEGH
jgi:hypothetical protein